MSATYMTRNSVWNDNRTKANDSTRNAAGNTVVDSRLKTGVGLFYSIQSGWQDGYDPSLDASGTAKDSNADYYSGWGVGSSRNPNYPHNLPSVRENMVLNATGTLTVADSIHGQWGPYAGSGDWADIWNPDSQLSYDPNNGAAWVDVNSPNGSQALHGKDMFNYLFVDGHVEFLDRAKTVGRSGRNGGAPGTGMGEGMWSIITTD